MSNIIHSIIIITISIIILKQIKKKEYKISIYFKPAIIIGVSILISPQLIAQLPTFDNPYVPIINEQVNHIDSLLDDNYQNKQIEIDGIKITGKIWENKIETTNYFTNNKSKLEIAFYLHDDELIFIKIIENSNKFRNLALSITDYYYHDGNLVLFWDYIRRPTGLAMQPDEDEKKFFGFNETFNEEFLTKYIKKLLHEIRKPQ